MPKMCHHGFWARLALKPNWSGGNFETLTNWDANNSTTYMNRNATIGGVQTPSPSSPSVTTGVSHVGTPILTHQISATLSIPNGPTNVKSLILSQSSDVGDFYQTAYGPYIVTKDAVAISSGQKVEFWYNASGTNGDGWIFIAYLINTNTNTTTVLRVASSTINSGWTLSSNTISTAGNYKFVLVSGSYDASGNKKIGASLQIAALSIK